MKIEHPILKLTFIDGGESYIIGESSIVIDSITVNDSLMTKEMKSTSRSVSLTVHRNVDSTILEKIIRETGDIKAELRKDPTTGDYKYFTGYLSKNLNYTIIEGGNNDISLTLEDFGTRMFKKTASRSTYISGTLTEAVRAILDFYGFTTLQVNSASAPEVNVQGVINEGESASSVLDKLLYEVGCVYTFENDGKLAIRKIPTTSVQTTATFDGNNLYSKGGTAVQMSKDLSVSNRVVVKYDTWFEEDNVLVYADISGASGANTEYNCSIQLNGRSYYPSSDGVPSTVDVQDIANGREIVSVKSITGETLSTGNADFTVEMYGSKQVKVNVHSLQDAVQTITRLRARATAVMVNGSYQVVVGDGAVTSENSETTTTYESSWIHTKTTAESLGNLILGFNKYCSWQYTFYSNTLVDTGTVCHLHDNVYTGLESNVLIISRIWDKGRDCYRYVSVGFDTPFVFGEVDFVGHTTSGSIISQVQDAMLQQIASLEGADTWSVTYEVQSGSISSFRGALLEDVTLLFHAEKSDGTRISVEWQEGDVSPEYTLSRSKGCTDNHVTVTAKYNGAVKNYRLDFIETDTGSAYNWGAVSELPTGVFRRGDYLTWIGETTSTFTKGEVYYYDGSTWFIANPTTYEGQKALINSTAGLLGAISSGVISSTEAGSTASKVLASTVLASQVLSVDSTVTGNLTIADTGKIQIMSDSGTASAILDKDRIELTDAIIKSQPLTTVINEEGGVYEGTIGDKVYTTCTLTQSVDMTQTVYMLGYINNTDTTEPAYASYDGGQAYFGSIVCMNNSTGQVYAVQICRGDSSVGPYRPYWKSLDTDDGDWSLLPYIGSVYRSVSWYRNVDELIYAHGLVTSALEQNGFSTTFRYFLATSAVPQVFVDEMMYGRNVKIEQFTYNMVGLRLTTDRRFHGWIPHFSDTLPASLYNRAIVDVNGTPTIVDAVEGSNVIAPDGTEYRYDKLYPLLQEPFSFQVYWYGKPKITFSKYSNGAWTDPVSVSTLPQEPEMEVLPIPEPYSTNSSLTMYDCNGTSIATSGIATKIERGEVVTMNGTEYNVVQYTLKPITYRLYVITDPIGLYCPSITLKDGSSQKGTTLTEAILIRLMAGIANGVMVPDYDNVIDIPDSAIPSNVTASVEHDGYTAPFNGYVSLGLHSIGHAGKAAKHCYIVNGVYFAFYKQYATGDEGFSNAMIPVRVGDNIKLGFMKYDDTTTLKVDGEIDVMTKQFIRSL